MSISEKLKAIAENEQKVYDAGKKAEHDRVWNEFQQDGKRVNYPYGFSGSYWNDNTYDPLYPIVCTNSSTYFFAYNSVCTTTKVPITIDTEKTNYTFFSCTRLKTIPSLTVTEKTAFTGWFSGGTTALETLIMHGTIAKNGFNVQDCTKLTHESLMSIIGCLKDYSADTSGTNWVVTIGSTNRAKLTEAEIQIAEQKGWTVK
jgi:hypothetical protein